MAISEAFAEAMGAIGNVAASLPLPAGLSSHSIGDWYLTVNNGKEPIDDVPPFHIKAQNIVFLAAGLIGPSGGLIGGYSEEQFIADMKAAATEASDV